MEIKEAFEARYQSGSPYRPIHYDYGVLVEEVGRCSCPIDKFFQTWVQAHNAPVVVPALYDHDLLLRGDHGPTIIDWDKGPYLVRKQLVLNRVDLETGKGFRDEEGCLRSHDPKYDVIWAGNFYKVVSTAMCAGKKWADTAPVMHRQMQVIEDRFAQVIFERRDALARVAELEALLEGERKWKNKKRSSTRSG